MLLSPYGSSLSLWKVEKPKWSERLIQRIVMTGFGDDFRDYRVFRTWRQGDVGRTYHQRSRSCVKCISRRSAGHFKQCNIPLMEGIARINLIRSKRYGKGNNTADNSGE